MQKSSFNIWRGGARALQLFAKIGLCACLCVFAMGCKSVEGKINFVIQKNIQTFVVRDILKFNSNDKYHHYNKAEKRNWGGVSVQVRSLIKCLSFNVSRSDRPSFINNQNFNVMRDTTDNCATCAQKPITAEGIIKDILIWDDPENIREDLHEMMLAFFMHYESPTEEFKGRIYCTYTTLYNALKQMETLNPRRAKQ